MLNTILQLIISWLLQKLWGLASDGLKDYLSQGRVEKLVRERLAEYEKIVLSLDSRMDSGEQVSQEELDEIRRKKIQIEMDLINRRP